MSAVPCQLDVRSQAATWSATVVSSRAEIADLQRRAPQLFRGRSSTHSPDFFLASMSGMSWIPRAIVVMQSDEIVGVVYAKERKLAGFATGLVYADGTLGAMVVSAPGSEEPVCRLAVSTLLTTPGIRGLRMSVPPDGFEIDEGIVGVITNRKISEGLPRRGHARWKIVESILGPAGESQCFEHYGSRCAHMARCVKPPAFGLSHPPAGGGRTGQVSNPGKSHWKRADAPVRARSSPPPKRIAEARPAPRI